MTLEKQWLKSTRICLVVINEEGLMKTSSSHTQKFSLNETKVTQFRHVLGISKLTNMRVCLTCRSHFRLNK